MPRSLFTPKLESLEDRCCPATIVSLFGTLTIVGNSQADTIVLNDDGQGGITGTVNGQAVSASNVRSVVIATGGGNDTVEYTLDGTRTKVLALSISLGGGNNEATVDFGAGITATVASVAVAGGSGIDNVSATFGEMSNSILAFSSGLGGGNDTLEANVVGDVLGTSKAAFAVDGFSGNDDITFNALGVNVDAGARLAMSLLGGTGGDTVAANYQGTLDGVLRVTLDGGFGNDTVGAELTVDAASTGKVNAIVNGSANDDTLTLNLIDNSGLLEAVTALLDGGFSFDTCTATSNVDVLRCEA